MPSLPKLPMVAWGGISNLQTKILHVGKQSAINHYTRKKVLKEFREMRLPWGL